MEFTLDIIEKQRKTVTLGDTEIEKIRKEIGDHKEEYTYQFPAEMIVNAFGKLYGEGKIYAGSENTEIRPEPWEVWWPEAERIKPETVLEGGVSDG